MKKNIMIIVIVIAFLLLGVKILFTPKEQISSYTNAVELQDNGSIEFYAFAKSLDSVIIIFRDKNNNKICDVHFNDVINNYNEIFVTSEDREYTWLAFNSQIKYNNRFLWCKSHNGRYIIVDYVNSRVFITFSYYQLKIGVAFLILIIIIIILLLKIKKLKRLQTK